MRLCVQSQEQYRAQAYIQYINTVISEIITNCSGLLRKPMLCTTKCQSLNSIGRGYTVMANIIDVFMLKSKGTSLLKT